MGSLLDKIKQPSFWVSMLGIIGVVGASLTGSGDPHLIAIGAILTGVYTVVDHLKDAVVQAAASVSAAKVEAAQAANTLPPFYQSDAQHPATPAGQGYAMPSVNVNLPQAPAPIPPAPVPPPIAGPAQGVSPSVVADQQAQLNDLNKQIADLHAKLNGSL